MTGSSVYPVRCLAYADELCVSISDREQFNYGLALGIHMMGNKAN